MGQKRDQNRNTEYFKLNDNENSTYQNLLDPAKAVLTKEFLALYSCIRKKKGLKLMIQDSTLRCQEKKIETNPEANRRNEIQCRNQ